MAGPVERQREGNGGKLLGGITGKGFLPGRSGNPGGMKPGTRTITSRLRDLLEKGEINGQPVKDGKQVADLLAEVILKGALKGDFRYVKELLDRVDGKVPDRIAGPDGQAIPITVIEVVRPPARPAGTTSEAIEGGS